MKQRTRFPMAAMAALALAALLAGCASEVPLNEGAAVESRTPTPVAQVPQGAASAAATPQSQVTTVELERQRQQQAMAAVASLPHVLYFDFDSYVLRDEYRSAIEGYAKALTTLKDHKLGLQGHTDERGGREYNLALGQKRAESVARALELLGVPAAQLEPVSFGEERPAEPGHDESAWAMNRRVEIQDR